MDGLRHCSRRVDQLVHPDREGNGRTLVLGSSTLPLRSSSLLISLAMRLKSTSPFSHRWLCLPALISSFGPAPAPVPVPRPSYLPVSLPQTSLPRLLSSWFRCPWSISTLANESSGARVRLGSGSGIAECAIGSGEIEMDDERVCD